MTPRRTLAEPVRLDPPAIAEFFKPARLEIYESLQTAGDASVAELAARLGRAADSLYYHVRKLERLGVIERREDEAAGEGSPGRNGAVFGVVARGVAMDLDPDSPASRDAWAGGARAVLRIAARDVESALAGGDVHTEGADRDLCVHRIKARLDERELRRVNGLLEELFTVLRDNADNTEGRLFALTCAFSPFEERPNR